jgi:large subunit ribosomal protein L10e
MFMGIRPGRAIRDPDKRPYTRYSKKKPRKSYVKAMPHRDIHQFRMGTKNDKFDLEMHLTCINPIILRDNSMESARMATNKYLEKNIVGDFYFIVRVYPHHIVRENKMIAGAGADRLQKGMRKAYGRPVDLAARLCAGTQLFSVYTFKQHEGIVRTAFAHAQRKLSGRYRLVCK